MKTTELLTALKEAQEQAAKGEWEKRSDLPYSLNGAVIFTGRGEENKTILRANPGSLSDLDDNVEAICTLRNNLPQIIAELEKLEGLVEALEKINERDSEDRKYELEIYQQLAQEALTNYRK